MPAFAGMTMVAVAVKCPAVPRATPTVPRTTPTVIPAKAGIQSRHDCGRLTPAHRHKPRGEPMRPGESKSGRVVRRLDRMDGGWASGNKLKQATPKRRRDSASQSL